MSRTRSQAILRTYLLNSCMTSGLQNPILHRANWNRRVNRLEPKSEPCSILQVRLTISSDLRSLQAFSKGILGASRWSTVSLSFGLARVLFVIESRLTLPKLTGSPLTKIRHWDAPTGHDCALCSRFSRRHKGPLLVMAPDRAFREALDDAALDGASGQFAATPVAQRQTAIL